MPAKLLTSRKVILRPLILRCPGSFRAWRRIRTRFFREYWSLKNMSAPVVPNPRRKGIAVILTTLSMFVIVPMVGLGIDVSTLYIVRAKLFEAADAAALAGARALSQGPDSNTQKSNAQAVAVRYFDA